MPKEVPTQLLTQIQAAIRRFENLDIRVGAVWLNPKEADAVSDAPTVFDKIGNRAVLEAMPGIIGVLWGVLVFESDIVPPGCIAVLPDGFEAKLRGREACFSLEET